MENPSKEVPTESQNQGDEPEEVKMEARVVERYENPYCPPMGAEFSTALESDKMKRKQIQKEVLKLPLHLRTTTSYRLSRTSSAAVKNIPPPTPIKEPPPSPTFTIQHDPRFTQAVAKGEKLRNMENIADYIKARRELFLMEYIIGVKRDKIIHLETLLNIEEQKLEAAENCLENDAVIFDAFLKHSDHETVEASKEVETQSRLKLEKIAEIKKISAQIVTLKVEIAKAEEVLTEYKLYGRFLDNLAPEDWKIAQEKKKALKKQILEKPVSAVPSVESQKKLKDSAIKLEGSPEDTKLSILSGIQFTDDDDDDELELFFTNPQQLLRIYMELEEKNLMLIQKSQETEETLEDILTSFYMTKQKMNKEVAVLKSQITILEKNVAWEENKANEFQVMSKLFSFGEFKEEYQEKILHELNRKVEAVYTSVIGPNDANISTLNMMTSIENLLEHLLETLDSLPPSRVEFASKIRDRQRRMMQREAKQSSQKEYQEEKMRRAAEKAKASTPREQRIGRRLVYRSEPPKIKLRSDYERKLKSKEEEEFIYFFT